MSEQDTTLSPSPQNPIEQENPENLQTSSNSEGVLNVQASEQAEEPVAVEPGVESAVEETVQPEQPPVAQVQPEPQAYAPVSSEQETTTTATPTYPSPAQQAPAVTSPESYPQPQPPYPPQQPVQPEYAQQPNQMQPQPQQQAYIPPQQPQQVQPQPAYAPAQPATPVATEPKPKNGKAIAALVCGILAVINAGTVVLGIILGIIAIIFGVLARKNSKSGMALGGLICGIVGIVLSFIVIIVLAFAIGSLSQADDPDRMIEDFLDGIGAGHNIVETTPGYMVANDQVCTIKLTGTDIDADGNLNIYFDMTNHTVTELDVYTDSLHPWTVNGVKADCVAFSWVDPDETKTKQCITVPAEYLPDNVKDVNDVWGLHGTLIVQLTNIGDEMYYPVVL